MKYQKKQHQQNPNKSPSMRREWIEIDIIKLLSRFNISLPPCGGSGLKCATVMVLTSGILVSLHAEGVD